ncbi:hypothetical protein VTN77DRAFT_9082 [Rasamsonia byssochlamydoides]|uniref:uncharacterized protein n=1 Tax=Rasamsonia byssochlamydoides TaxID=89139 RepID=UPI003742038A
MPLRGPSRGSHLRQVSAASLDSTSTGPSLLGTSQYDPSAANEKSDKQPGAGLYRQLCTLWVHDESFSREEVLFNSSAFSETGVKPGDVIEITLVRNGGDSAHPQLKSEFGARAVNDGNVESNSSLSLGGNAKFASRTQGRFLFVVKPLPQDIKQRHPKLEISVTSSVANIFGFKNRSPVLLSQVDRSQCSASHVDISFRDQYLVRADMWRLVTSELVDKTIYKGQKILFMGSIKATIKHIFIRGKKVLSGYFAPNTIPVFRSESARYVLFIQMSREMWDFDSEGTGDILFSRVINGFLPELFKRWANIDAKHLVTIVLFTRVEYDVAPEHGASALSIDPLKRISSADPVPMRDFYRVVVNDIASGHWTAILDELKKNFRTFLRDVSIQKFVNPDDSSTTDGGKAKTPQIVTIAGRPTSAIRGNILEAIHLATSHLAYDHIDRDMGRTGTSIVVITPGTGLFEVSYESLAATNEALTNIGIAIDLVCLSPMPLHSVPLFKYRRPQERPSSSRFGDSHSHLSTPDYRHSTASFTSKLSPFSPRSSDLSTFPRPFSRDRPPANSKEWCYGIPHWLDISFWNPETYREGRRIAKKDLNAPIPYTVTKQSKLFVPRVRMYEIQMMGIMESEQSNISIPYLSERNYGFQRTLNLTPSSHPSIMVSHAGKYPLSPSSSYRVQLSDSLRPEPFLSSFTSPKEMMLPSPAKHQRRMLSWMDDYDDHVFHPFPKKRHSRRQSKSKRPSEPENHVSHLQERLSARSIMSLREHEEHEMERASSLRSTQRRVDTPLASPKSPVSTQDKSPRKPAIKTNRAPRISRTISFALRGLGPAPPRAQASTEVNAEHARALPILNRKTSAAAIASDSESIKQRKSDETSSISTVTELPPRPSTPKKATEKLEVPQSRPISIKVGNKKVLEETETERQSAENSFPTATELPIDTGNHGGSHGPFPMKRTGPKFEMGLNAGARDASSSHSPSKALAPWVRSINPSNTPKAALRDASWFGRWQHAYPRPPHVALVKWKSLKTPAVLPLTTEEFPSRQELASDYLQTPYRVFPNDDHEGEDATKARDAILREMVALRLSHGFQIVVGSAVAEVSGQYSLESLNVFDPRGLGRDEATIFLSKGNIIHRLVCVAGGEIEVTKFTRLTPSASPFEKRDTPTYTAAIRTILGKEYELNNVKLQSSTEEYNWNYADNYLAGHRDHLTNPTKQLRFWRTRYVLIPMRLPPNSRRPFNEDNEEEIHLLGINQLTHLWQRHKYVPPEEKRFQTAARKKKDQNPLNIMYQTRNPSEVVAAELDRILLTDPGLDNPPAQLLPDSELLERSNISLSSLAQIIQSDKGVRMMDRRWHWRLHYNCFIGSEFTTWLLQNFRDIDTREEAVEFGNELMKHGLFQHVEQRHNFRDGNYFYQIAAEYRVSRPPESRTGWFPGRKPEKSVPSTPQGEGAKDSPSGERTRSDSVDETAASAANTPSKSKSKVAILLSKSMKYDVDPRKRSHRPEVIDLHYDRLHNPENCFHIELSWMSATPKLIEDAVVSWAATAEKYGLKLVQVPIAEASATVEEQPFRKLYRVKLKVEPPKPPATLSYSATSFSQQGKPDKHYYQKAILRKFDFVLDFEAASAFPPDVEVLYSWGKPNYRYPQYIHRSGCLLAQISEEGDFLFLANRLFSTKGASGRDATNKFDRGDRTDQYRPRPTTYTYDPMFSPRLSPALRPVPEPTANTGAGGSNPPHTIDTANLYRTPEYLKNQVEEFCNDEVRLQQFYSEAQTRPSSTRVGPIVPPSTASTMESSIPSLELPASVVGPHISSPAAAVLESDNNNNNPEAAAAATIASAAIDTTPQREQAGAGTDGAGSIKESPRSGDLKPVH